MTRISLILSGLLIICSPYLGAQWSTDPAVNTPICRAPNDQHVNMIITDGRGGAMILWYDRRRNSNGEDIFAQWIDSAGVLRWASEGVLVATADSGGYDNFQAVSYASGGFIIAWEYESSSIEAVFAQRINVAGVRQWGANGVPICTTTSISPQLIEDGSGGAIMVWEDLRLGTNDGQIYAQRINSSGVPQWSPNGVPVCTAAFNQTRPKIVRDGSTGAIIAWGDRRGNTDSDIYAQRINSVGATQWTSNGIPICTASSDQGAGWVLPDETGGAIVVWSDSRNVTPPEFYAQRVNPVGAVQWSANGVRLGAIQGSLYNSSVRKDGSGGALLAWNYETSQGNVYAQRINSTGNIQWGTNGVAVCTASGRRFFSSIVSDGAGGAIIAWSDFRNGGEANKDIYAQRINASGLPQWILNGVAISSAVGSQYFLDITIGADGGAIIAWEDTRNGETNSDIYAQRVNSNGTLGGPTSVGGSYNMPVHFTLHQNYPNPFNPSTVIDYELPNAHNATLRVFDLLGREVAILVNERLPAGVYSAEWNATGFASGVYYYQMRAGDFVKTKKLILLR